MAGNLLLKELESAIYMIVHIISQYLTKPFKTVRKVIFRLQATKTCILFFHKVVAKRVESYLVEQIRFSHVANICCKKCWRTYFILSLIPFRNLRQPCLKAVLIFGGKTRAVSLTGPSAKMLQKRGNFFVSPFTVASKTLFLKGCCFAKRRYHFWEVEGR